MSDSSPGTEPERGTGRIGTDAPPDGDPYDVTSGTPAGPAAPGEQRLDDVREEERLEAAEAGFDEV
jgi:hypothetical protein